MAKVGRLPLASVMDNTLGRVTGFIGRQKHNYRVAVTRSAANSFLLNLSAQYDSIYTVALGAGSLELGGVSSIGGGISALISIPVGWMVDRHRPDPGSVWDSAGPAGGQGRAKKVIYLLVPLWYASYLLLVFSFGPVTLILAGALQAFYFVSSGVTGAMSLELVPVEQMGKWSGMIGLSRGLIAVPAPLLGGLVWDHLDPVYVFLIPLAVDLLIKLPLLLTVPETLETRQAV